MGWYPILFEAFSYYWQATHRRKGRSKVPPPPRLFFHEIAGFGTSSRSYFLKHGDPSPPRRHLLIVFFLRQRNMLRHVFVASSSSSRVAMKHVSLNISHRFLGASVFESRNRLVLCKVISIGFAFAVLIVVCPGYRNVCNTLWCSQTLVSRELVQPVNSGAPQERWMQPYRSMQKQMRLRRACVAVDACSGRGGTFGPKRWVTDGLLFTDHAQGRFATMPRPLQIYSTGCRTDQNTPSSNLWQNSVQNQFNSPRYLRGGKLVTT